MVGEHKLSDISDCISEYYSEHVDAFFIYKYHLRSFTVVGWLGHRGLVWSNCTIQTITKALPGPNRTCLLDTPNYDPEYERCGNKVLDIGKPAQWHHSNLSVAPFEMIIMIFCMKL